MFNSELIKESNSQANNSLDQQQRKILKLLSVIFLFNSLFIFICPWFMPEVKASVQINPVRQLVFLFAAFMILAIEFYLKRKTEFSMQSYKLYIICLCLCEAIIVLSMLSMSAFSDVTIYILLGLVGFYKLIIQSKSLLSK